MSDIIYRTRQKLELIIFDHLEPGRSSILNKEKMQQMFFTSLALVVMAMIVIVGATKEEKLISVVRAAPPFPPIRVEHASL